MAKIIIQSIVVASPRKVWDSWTDPKHITKWNFAYHDWQCPKASNDLKVGGKYTARMEAKNGSIGFDFEATYNEIVDLKKITYTMGDGRIATTKFDDLGGTTKITTVFDAETQNSEEMQKEGWQAILNNFKKYVESTRNQNSM